MNNGQKWNKVYKNITGRKSIWTDLNPKYEGASSYIVEKIKKLPKSVKILDAGCGDGRNLIYLTGLGYKITGIDISPEAIRKAKNKLASKKLTADLVVGNLYDLPYSDKSFDAIYYDFTNVHIGNPEAILKEFFRVLKIGGLLLFETTSKLDPLYKGRNKFFEEGFYFRFYSRREVINLIKKYFQVEKVELNKINHLNHGYGYAKRKKHFHKSYLIIAEK